MRQIQQGMRRRAVALLGVLALHALLIAFGLRMHVWRLPTLHPQAFTQLFWVEPPAAEVNQSAAVDRTPALNPPARSPSKPSASSTAITVPPVLDEKPGRIDWNAQGKEAAAEILRNRADRERLAAPFTQRAPLMEPKSREKRDAGWREYRFRGHGRLETQDGVPVFHLSDRCALIALIIPACVFGKMPTADMYKDMKEWERHRGEEELP